MRIISEYLPGADNQQDTEPISESNPTTDMSMFDLTTRGTGLHRSRSFDVMDLSAYIVPPKSFSHGNQPIFDMNMNLFSDSILSNRNFEVRSSTDAILKEVFFPPPSDGGIRERTETRHTTVEMKVKGHQEVVPTAETKVKGHPDVALITEVVSDEKEEAAAEVEVEDDVEVFVEDCDDDIESEEKAPDVSEPEVKRSEEWRPDAEVKDSAVLNLIDTMLDIQQKYNHLKSNLDHVGNILSQSLEYAPIPGVGLVKRMFGLSDSEAEDSTARAASRRPYLPHGPCKRCAEKQRRREAHKQTGSRNNVPRDTNSCHVTRPGEELRGHSESESGHSCDKRKTDQTKLNMDSPSPVTDTNAKESSDCDTKQKPRNLSKMSRDCASINRMLLGVAKSSLRQQKMKASTS